MFYFNYRVVNNEDTPLPVQIYHFYGINFGIPIAKFDHQLCILHLCNFNTLLKMLVGLFRAAKRNLSQHQIQRAISFWLHFDNEEKNTNVFFSHFLCNILSLYGGLYTSPSIGVVYFDQRWGAVPPNTFSMGFIYTIVNIYMSRIIFTINFRWPFTSLSF